MVKVKMANPGPSALMVINPKKGSKTMATTRRKTRRRTTARRKTSTVASSKRNPTRRIASGRKYARRKSLRRNPAATGLLKNAVGVAGAMAALGLLSAFVPPVGGNSIYAVAGRQMALGYLAGEGMARFRVLPAYANDMKLAGFVLGAGTIINALVLPTVSGFLRPAPKADNKKDSNGMGDIVTLPRGSWDDYYGSTPNFRTNPASGRTGMNGVITMPRVSGY